MTRYPAAMFRLALIFLSLLLSVDVARADDEEAQIVTTCHYGNAEWGYDMINRCIDENRAQRAEVLRLPAEHAAAVFRCRQSAELGWAWVQTCVQKDAQARAALATYPAAAAALIKTCSAELGAAGSPAIKDCVDKGLGSSATK